MLKMLEVVGTSPNSYYEAVRTAVENVAASGEKVHFFKVTEHRGAYHGGKVEFQAVVKVAVES
jgi:flavin-binding protein dodecin